MKTVRLHYRCINCEARWQDEIELEDDVADEKQLEVEFNAWHACGTNVKGRSELSAIEYEEESDGG